MAIFRSGVDAEKIQHYREKLQQSMRVFGVSIFFSGVIKIPTIYGAFRSFNRTSSFAKLSQSLSLARSR